MTTERLEFIIDLSGFLGTWDQRSAQEVAREIEDGVYAALTRHLINRDIPFEDVEYGPKRDFHDA